MHTENLIVAPSVYVAASTTLNQVGIEKWVENRRFYDSEDYPTSPLVGIQNASSVAPGGMEAEIISELAGRFCYNSMLKGRPSDEYIANILEQRHGSVLEHTTFSLIIEGVSRSLSHELVRHRAGFAISQESQRYVDARDIRFVVPPILLHLWDNNMDCGEAKEFAQRCEEDLDDYRHWQHYIADNLISAGMNKTLAKKRANEAARWKLPNASETRLFWTGNLRAMRHFCELRGGEHADLEIRRLAVEITKIMQQTSPYTFHDFTVEDGDFGVNIVTCDYTKV